MIAMNCTVRIYNPTCLRLLLGSLLLAVWIVSAKDVTLSFYPRKGTDLVAATDYQGWSGRSVILREVIDNRKASAFSKDGQVIGISRQKDDEPYISYENVATWSSRALRFTLSTDGVCLVKDNASFIIEPTLNRFFVTEESTYRGVVSMGFTIKTPSGEVIWSGEIADSSNFWGSTQSEEEFLSALGNAFVNMVRKLIQDERVNEALVGHTQPSHETLCQHFSSPEDLGRAPA